MGGTGGWGEIQTWFCARKSVVSELSCSRFSIRVISLNERSRSSSFERASSPSIRLNRFSYSSSSRSEAHP